ncbi:hypothetical protein COB64_02345 [Candidatus Wolfebacteria bacterium]|nr:MAG: hypothetical protein COB64_02345 [Candidatus Wolfebacteria bacterium]
MASKCILGIVIAALFLSISFFSLPRESLAQNNNTLPNYQQNPDYSSGNNSYFLETGKLGGNIQSNVPPSNEGEGACFPAGTQISLADGTTKNIEDVNIGDLVIAYDEETGEKKSAKVLELEAPIAEGYYKLNEDLLRVTDEHPMYTRKADGAEGWASIVPEKTIELFEWDSMLSLEVGDSVLTLDDEWVELVSIEYVEGEIQTYNLKSVESYQTFFADGVLVHNKSKPENEVNVINITTIVPASVEIKGPGGENWSVGIPRPLIFEQEIDPASDVNDVYGYEVQGSFSAGFPDDFPSSSLFDNATVGPFINPISVITNIPVEFGIINDFFPLPNKFFQEDIIYKNYYWRWKNLGQFGVPSNEWSLTNVSTEISPPVPQAIWKINVSEETNWDLIPGADSYDLYMIPWAEKEDLNSSLLGIYNVLQDMDEDELELGLNANTDYVWGMLFKNSSGQSLGVDPLYRGSLKYSFGDFKHFRFGNFCGIPKFVDTGGSGINSLPYLEFKSILGAEEYQIQLSQTPIADTDTFVVYANIKEDDYDLVWTDASSLGGWNYLIHYVPPGLVAGNEYYWRVRGIDTDTGTNKVITTLSHVGEFTSEDTRVDLVPATPITWNKDSNALYYIVDAVEGNSSKFGLLPRLPNQFLTAKEVKEALKKSKAKTQQIDNFSKPDNDDSGTTTSSNGKVLLNDDKIKSLFGKVAHAQGSIPTSTDYLFRKTNVASFLTGTEVAARNLAEKIKTENIGLYTIMRGQPYVDWFDNYYWTLGYQGIDGYVQELYTELINTANYNVREVEMEIFPRLAYKLGLARVINYFPNHKYAFDADAIVVDGNEITLKGDIDITDASTGGASISINKAAGFTELTLTGNGGMFGLTFGSGTAGETWTHTIRESFIDLDTNNDGVEDQVYYELKDLYPGSTYQWRVKAVGLNNSGNIIVSPWSSVSSFTAPETRARGVDSISVSEVGFKPVSVKDDDQEITKDLNFIGRIRYNLANETKKEVLMDKILKEKLNNLTGGMLNKMEHPIQKFNKNRIQQVSVIESSKVGDSQQETIEKRNLFRRVFRRK